MERRPQNRAVSLVLILGFVVIALFFLTQFWKGRPQRQLAIQERRTAETLVQTVLQSAPVEGNENAKILLMEYGDFECPSCKESAALIQQALGKRPNLVRHAWIHAFSSQAHPASESAAVASQCANQQGKFWPFHDLLFQEQDKLAPLLYNQIAQTLKLDMTAFQACLATSLIRDQVTAHTQFSVRQGITDVPYVVINDRPVPYPFTVDQLLTFIDQASSSL